MDDHGHGKRVSVDYSPEDSLSPSKRPKLLPNSLSSPSINTLKLKNPIVSSLSTVSLSPSSSLDTVSSDIFIKKINFLWYPVLAQSPFSPSLSITYRLVLVSTQERPSQNLFSNEACNSFDYHDLDSIKPPSLESESIFDLDLGFTITSNILKIIPKKKFATYSSFSNCFDTMSSLEKDYSEKEHKILFCLSSPDLQTNAKSKITLFLRRKILSNYKARTENNETEYNSLVEKVYANYDDEIRKSCKGLEQSIQYYTCENDDTFEYGINNNLSSKYSYIRLKKYTGLIFNVNMTNGKMFLERKAELLVIFLSEDEENYLIVDLENDVKNNIYGNLLQKTRYGEVYKGLQLKKTPAYSGDSSSGYYFISRSCQDFFVFKSFTFYQSYRSLKSETSLQTFIPYLDNNFSSENIVVEIQISSYLNDINNFDSQFSLKNNLLDMSDLLEIKNALKISNISTISSKIITSIHNFYSDFNFLSISKYLKNSITLLDYLKIQKEKRLNEVDFKVIMRQLVSMFYFLHSVGVSHQDISPENILVSYKRPLTIAKSLDNFSSASLTSIETSASHPSVFSLSNSSSSSFDSMDDFGSKNLECFLIDLGQAKLHEQNQDDFPPVTPQRITSNEFDKLNNSSYYSKFKKLLKNNSGSGKVPYQPPELLSNKYLNSFTDLKINQTYYGFNVDVWQLGVLFFYLLTGYNPVTAGSSTESYRKFFSHKKELNEQIVCFEEEYNLFKATHPADNPSEVNNDSLSVLKTKLNHLIIWMELLDSSCSEEFISTFDNQILSWREIDSNGEKIKREKLCKLISPESLTLLKKFLKIDPSKRVILKDLIHSL